MIDSSKRLLGDSLFGAPSYFAAKAMAKENPKKFIFITLTKNLQEKLEVARFISCL